MTGRSKMAVPENGWSTLAEAVTYFANERLTTTHWDDLASNDIKNSCLNMGYNRLLYADDFSIPAAPSAAELVILKKAQAEMSYYIALHNADEDRRKGLQAQGVVSAGIIKEAYDKDMLNEIPIPPIVREMMSIFEKYSDEIYITSIDRDEDSDVDEDVTDL